MMYLRCTIDQILKSLKADFFGVSQLNKGLILAGILLSGLLLVGCSSTQSKDNANTKSSSLVANNKKKAVDSSKAISESKAKIERKTKASSIAKKHSEDKASSASAASSSIAAQQSSKQVAASQSQSSANSEPTTLTGFLNKYGMSPAAYKMEHDGMTQEQALKATPDSMETSGEIQMENQYK